jgi:hypothetical protein
MGSHNPFAQQTSTDQPSDQNATPTDDLEAKLLAVQRLTKFTQVSHDYLIEETARKKEHKLMRDDEEEQCSICLCEFDEEDPAI